MQNKINNLFYIKRTLDEFKKIGGIKVRYDFVSDSFLIKGKNNYHVERVLENGVYFLNLYIVNDFNGLDLFEKPKYFLSINEVCCFVNKKEKE